MIPISKLGKLRGRALLRKCALLLEAVERGVEAPDYALELASHLLGRADLPAEVAAAASLYLRDSSAAAASGGDGVRALNAFRHSLRQASGQSTADWDLVVATRGPSSVAEVPASGKRPFLPGLRVFLEDLRSPFNVGSVLRTAEAFGFEEVLLSPDCADPRHPRAARSSMGAVDLVPWRRCSLEELHAFGPVLALELGGEGLRTFSFPSSGVLILGSEELGVSGPALALAGERRVSIPLVGAKASLNVAVAFGIAAQAWTTSIPR